MRPEPAQPFVPQSFVRSLIYRRLLAWADRFYRVGNGCVYAAAGLLRRTELQAASVYQYRDFALSSFEVDAGLTPAEDYFYRKFLHEGDKVLLAGSGSGRDLLALRRMGFDVTGLEPISELAELARQHLARCSLTATVRVGLIQAAELGGPYDAVIFSNGCYALVQGADLRVATLSRLATHLSSKGRVIVSYQPAGVHSHGGSWLARATARLARGDWRPEAGDTFSRDLSERTLVRYQHLLDATTFARECAAAGFRVLADEYFEEGCRMAVAAADDA
jgi:hypothetical protein